MSTIPSINTISPQRSTITFLPSGMVILCLAPRIYWTETKESKELHMWSVAPLSMIHLETFILERKHILPVRFTTLGMVSRSMGT